MGSIVNLFASDNPLQIGEVTKIYGKNVFEIITKNKKYKVFNTTNESLSIGAKVVISLVDGKRFIISTTQQTTDNIKEIFQNG